MPYFRALLCLVAFLAGLPASAQDPTSGRISLELNTLETVNGSCRLTFLLQNKLDTDIESLAVETVLFSRDNQVLLLTLFDFGTLPAQRMRVRQFQVPDTTCDMLGMVLINGASRCSGGDLTPQICEQAFDLRSRGDIALEG